MNSLKFLNSSTNEASVAALMESNHMTDDVDVPLSTLQWLRRQCELDSRSWEDASICCPVNLLILLGEEMGSAVTTAIKQVVWKHTPGSFSHMIVHLIRPDKTAREGLMVQDVQDHATTDTVGVLLAVTGVGVVSLTKKS
jgi:hypothetical protein